MSFSFDRSQQIWIGFNCDFTLGWGYSYIIGGGGDIWLYDNHEILTIPIAGIFFTRGGHRPESTDSEKHCKSSESIVNQADRIRSVVA